MIANYGYADGSGEYFITIDTSSCAGCKTNACVQACPGGIFEIITDDYDETAAAVKREFRKTLKYGCAPCKPVAGTPAVPCVSACGYGAIKHSW